jgi:hypothetical protein
VNTVMMVYDRLKLRKAGESPPGNSRREKALPRILQVLHRSSCPIFDPGHGHAAESSAGMALRTGSIRDREDVEIPVVRMQL